MNIISYLNKEESIIIEALINLNQDKTISPADKTRLEMEIKLDLQRIMFLRNQQFERENASLRQEIRAFMNFE